MVICKIEHLKLIVLKQREEGRKSLLAILKHSVRKEHLELVIGRSISRKEKVAQLARAAVDTGIHKVLERMRSNKTMREGIVYILGINNPDTEPLSTTQADQRPQGPLPKPLTQRRGGVTITREGIAPPASQLISLKPVTGGLKATVFFKDRIILRSISTCKYRTPSIALRRDRNIQDNRIQWIGNIQDHKVAPG